MIGINPEITMSLVAGEAIAPALRVKWGATAGQVVIAGNEACIGISKTRAYQQGDRITILDIKACGTLPWTVAGAIDAGESFASAAGGTVEAYDAEADPAQAEVYGVAFTAATGAGQQIEGSSGL